MQYAAGKNVKKREAKLLEFVPKVMALAVQVSSKIKKNTGCWIILHFLIVI